MKFKKREKNYKDIFVHLLQADDFSYMKRTFLEVDFINFKQRIHVFFFKERKITLPTEANITTAWGYS